MIWTSKCCYMSESRIKEWSSVQSKCSLWEDPYFIYVCLVASMCQSESIPEWLTSLHNSEPSEMLFFCWKEALTFLCPCGLIEHLWGLPSISIDLKKKKAEILLTSKRLKICSLWIHLIGCHLTNVSIVITLIFQGKQCVRGWNCSNPISKLLT